MALERNLVEISKPAAADLSALQYRAVLINSAGAVNIATGTASAIIGVLQNKPDVAGAAARVAIYGVTKMIASASITAGAWVTSNGEGMAVTAGTGDNVSQAIGRALQTAQASLNVIEVLLAPHTV